MARERTKTPQRGSAQGERQPRQRITYTPAKPFFRNRLLVQLVTIAAVVLAFTVSISIFFKVDTIVVTGAEKHSAWSISQASGIQEGDSLLFFGRSKAAGKIKLELPYVSTVRFQVSLPGTVNIIVEEKPVGYAVQDQNGSWWLITSDGKVAEQVDAQTAEKSAVITGLTLASPAVGRTAVAAETRQDSSDLASVTAADRLEAALTVLYQVERCELFDRVTEVDVTDLFALRMYCGSSYRIELGDTSSMGDKMSAVKMTMAQLGIGGSGVLKLLYRDETWQVLHQSWSQP